MRAPGGADHLEVDAQLAAVFDADAGILRLIGVEHRRDIVLGVAGGEKHARHREHSRHALVAQPVEAGMDHRIAEFQIAIFDGRLRIAFLQPLRDLGEFARRVLVAAAMAADHDAELFARAHACVLSGSPLASSASGCSSSGCFFLPAFAASAARAAAPSAAAMPTQWAWPASSPTCPICA